MCASGADVSHRSFTRGDRRSRQHHPRDSTCSLASTSAEYCLVAFSGSADAEESASVSDCVALESDVPAAPISPRLRDVKRARGHEENVIGLHHSVLGLDVRSFNNGEKITLHALA